eukprot:7927719-Pyramimonas_sp.AAC.1
MRYSAWLQVVSRQGGWQQVICSRSGPLRKLIGHITTIYTSRGLRNVHVTSRSTRSRAVPHVVQSQEGGEHIVPHV